MMSRVTLSMLAVAVLTAVAGAQEPPRAERPPRPVPAPAPTPVPAEMAERLRLEAERVRSLAPEIEMRARDLEWQLQRELAPHVEELQWRMQHELAPHLEEMEWQLQSEQRELERHAREMEREWAQQAREFEREMQRHEFEWNRDIEVALAPHLDEARLGLEELRRSAVAESFARRGAPLSIELPESRFPQDPADSLYRAAREMLNRGEYRRAAQTFRVITERYATSKYAPDAMYYEAFALYRIGTVADMRAALALLEQQRQKYPRSETDREAASLAMRIRGELAANGDTRAASELTGVAGSRNVQLTRPPVVYIAGDAPGATPRARTAGSQGAQCDRDSLAVKLEALSALSKIESPEVTPALRRVLQRRDECSASLRRRAVLLLGQQAGAEIGDVLIEVAKNDPDLDVRREAIGLLAKVTTDEAVAALQEIVQTGDTRLTSSALRALNSNPNPRARQAVRTVLERNDIAESVRLSALASFSRASPEEAAYLRSVYPKLESRRLRSQAISTIARLGGSENEQWLLALARNEGESIELRQEAVARLAQTAPIADVARLYDQANDRRLKERIIRSLAAREESEAVDKLIAIARGDSDQELRRLAISRLSQKKDPRTTQLLLEIIGR